VDQEEEMSTALLEQAGAAAEVGVADQLCCHDNCYMSSIKGARNGFYYGSRLRFAHAFVMSILFGKGKLEDRLNWAIKMAFSHGKLLAIFAFTYKTAQCILTKLYGK
jgi:hypothetical protein